MSIVRAAGVVGRVTCRLAGFAAIFVLSVVAKGQSNLLANGGFDRDLSGWSVPSSLSTNGTTQWASADANSSPGSGSAQGKWTALPNTLNSQTMLRQRVPIVGSGTYTLTGKVNVVVAGSGTSIPGNGMLVCWFRADNSFVSCDGTGNASSVGVWASLSASATAPADATTAEIELVVAETQGNTVSFDDVSLTGAPPVPLQASLRAVPSTVTAGKPVTLVWSALGAASVTLDGSGVASSDSKSVIPTQTTTYKLLAANGSQSVNASATVSVTTVPPPQVSLFSATPSSTSSGQTVTLSWSTSGGSTVSIDNGVGAVSASGSTTVNVAGSTIYALTAVGPGGTSTRTAQVVVNVRPPAVLATLGTPGVTGSTDGNAALFNQPAAIGLDASGNIYVVDSGNHTIRKIDPSGLTVTWLGQAGKSGFADGLRNAALFDFTGFSGGMYVFADGSLVIYDHSNFKRIVDAKGNVSTCKLVSCAAKLFVIGMASDSGSNFYEAESANNRILRTAKGATTAVSFAGGGAAGFTDGQGTAATFNNPRGLAIDASDTLYVGDTGNNAIRKITPGGLVSTLAKDFSFGCCGGMIAIDKQGILYVADTGSNTVKRITASGAVQTLVGSGAAGSSNGEGILASFQDPNGVAIGPDGGLVISDTGNGTIRKTNPVAATTTKRRAVGK